MHYKISQFADDSTFILTIGDEIRLAIHIRTWELATGMSENLDKREGMLLGRLRRTPELAPNIVPDGWVKDGEPIRSLGVPMGNDLDETAWWMARYRTVKQRVSWWRINSSLSMVGRNSLLQSIYYGSFRFWLFSLVLPVKVLKLMKEDAKQILWASQPLLTTSEDGTSKHSVPYIHAKASPLPRKEGGGNVMDWEIHVEAFYAQWGRRYLDPRKAPWKLVLDHYIANKYHIGRGILVAKLGSKERLWADVPKQARYARRCIRAFEDLHITQHDQISVDTQADPLFNNNFFDTGLDAAAAKQWQARLDTTQLVDLLNEDGQLFTPQEWHDTFHAMAPTRMRGKQRSHEWVTARSGELATLSANLPTERLEMAAMDPYLVDGAYVGVFSDREASDLKYAQVHTADDGECTLHEVWIDLSGFPHLTGDTVYWPNKVQECATGTPYPSGHRRHGCAKSTNVGTDSFFSIANVPSQPKATVH